MTSPDVAYAAAVLAIYLVLFWPALYTLIKHGFRHLAWMGWLYFLLFCSLRIIGSALQISHPQSIAAAIISSVGLSPLTIAVGGVLHEARHYLLSATTTVESRKIDLILVLLFHIAVMTAIALLAVGASGLSNAQIDPAQVTKDWHLAGGGAVLLALVIVILFAAAVFTYLPAPSSASSSSSSKGRTLVLAAAMACPFLFVRVVGSAVYFLCKNEDMNPISGSWGVRIGVYLVPEMVAGVMLLVGGLVTQGLRNEEGGRRSEDGKMNMGRV